MTGPDDAQRSAYLSWATALEAALRRLGYRPVRADEIDADTQCALSDAVAAAICSLAADADRLGLTWRDIEDVARTELVANTSYRTSHPIPQQPLAVIPGCRRPDADA